MSLSTSRRPSGLERQAEYSGALAISWNNARRRKVPTFLLGHSLGGAVAIHLARDRPPPTLKGVLLTAPAVRVYPKPLLRFMAPVLATLAPLMPVQKLRFDKRRGENKRVPDPLVVRCSVRARVGYEVLKSCERIMNEAVRFRVPLFVAHSKKDRVTNAGGSIEFCNRVASRDKTVALYDGKMHDLLSRGAPPVLDDMIVWADKRVGQPTKVPVRKKWWSILGSR